MRFYRALLHLYPRRFRLEYGDDMVALLAEQLAAEPASRITRRVAVDLLVTVPTSHLEAHVPTASTTPLVITFAAAAAALTIFGGAVGVVGAVLLLLVSLLIWRHDRPVVADDSRWWKLLVAGALLLGALIVVTTITGELPSGGWYVAMVALFTSLGLIGSGVVLGLSGRLRPTPGS